MDAQIFSLRCLARASVGTLAPLSRMAELPMDIPLEIEMVAAVQAD
jgi:hypothetical protein